MRKIFSNTGGLFLCEVRDHPYEHKTNKPIFVTVGNTITVSDDPEVQVFLAERSKTNKRLRDEMLQVATGLGITYLDDIDRDVEQNDADKLTSALISLGWENEFIPIGP